MRKKDAKAFAYRSVIVSLRRKAELVRTADIGPSATQKDVAKVKVEMLALAQVLDQKLNRRRKGGAETGAPGPKGPDGVPEGGQAAG